MTTKTLRIISVILRSILAILIILFSIATLMGKSYIQTSILWLAALALLWWPGYIKNKLNNTVSVFSRVFFILILLVLNFTAFKTGPKTSIYLSEEHRLEVLSVYDKMLADWPADTESIYLDTGYGKVHVLACGNPENPPLVMIHAAAMGAHSWAENLNPLIDNFRIYSIDNIGEGGRSVLKDAEKYPNSGKEIADLYSDIMDMLDIESAPVFGASNGGYIAQVLAYYHPDKVESLALFGPMGITQLTGSSFFMLSVSTMYPFQFIRNAVTRWAIGEDDYVIRKYGNWFNAMMKGTIPSVARPIPMSTEQKKSIEVPVLLFLGTKDAIVGDAETARKTAEDYPNIRIITLESGHLIAVEHAERINEEITGFLSLN